jgi:hypothetical protein
MGISSFVGKNVGPSAWIAGGFMVGAYGFITDVRDMVTLGVQPDYIQLAGFCLFSVGVVSMLYRQHVMLESKLAGASPVAAAAFEPARPDPTRPPPVAEPESRPSSSPVTDRKFTPASVAKEFLAMHRRRHTEGEVNALLRPHSGQWIKITGVVAQVTGTKDRVFVRMKPSNSWEHDSFTATFDPRFLPTLERMAIGDKVVANFEIVDTDFGPRLQNGEML